MKRHSLRQAARCWDEIAKRDHLQRKSDNNYLRFWLALHGLELLAGPQLKLPLGGNGCTAR
jgi:hypothetical protein